MLNVPNANRYELSLTEYIIIWYMDFSSNIAQLLAEYKHNTNKKLLCYLFMFCKGLFERELV